MYIINVPLRDFYLIKQRLRDVSCRIDYLCLNHERKEYQRPTEAFPAGIYLLKVNNRNTRTKCEICSKLTIKTPERRQRH